MSDDLENELMGHFVVGSIFTFVFILTFIRAWKKNKLAEGGG
ncbi:MAG: hypothetical protein V3T58_08215 [Candidatus Hydrothermarchaeales archaeon]